MFDKFLIDIISLVAFKDDLLILFRSSSLMLLAVPILDAEIAIVSTFGCPQQELPRFPLVAKNLTGVGFRL